MTDTETKPETQSKSEIIKLKVGPDEVYIGQLERLKAAGWNIEELHRELLYHGSSPHWLPWHTVTYHITRQ